MLLSEINEKGRQLDKKIGIYFYNYTDEDRLSLELNGGSDSEGISIKAEVRLQDDEGWKYQEEKLKREERIIEALTHFKNILNKVINGELDLNKPRKVWEDESLEWHDGIRTQQELYDYELIC